MSDSDDRGTPVRIRRVPRFGVFLGLGGAIGVIVALILTSLFPIDPSVGFGPTFGYFALYGLVIGVFVGAVLAIVLDRIFSRLAKTATATVDRLEIPWDDDEPDAEAEPRQESGTEEPGE